MVGRRLPVGSLRQRCRALEGQLRAAGERIGQLEAELAAARGQSAAVESQRNVLQGTVRRQAKELYGRKTEQSVPPVGSEKPRKPRGQQPGAPGHGRRPYDNLVIATVHRWRRLPAADRTCGCGQVAGPCGTEKSVVIAYRTGLVRIVTHGERYVFTCACPDRPRHLVAAVPAKLWPRALLGPDLLAKILVEKFLLMRPLHRAVAALATEGLSLAEGSLVGMFWQLQPMMAPPCWACFRNGLTEEWWTEVGGRRECVGLCELHMKDPVVCM